MKKGQSKKRAGRSKLRQEDATAPLDCPPVKLEELQFALVTAYAAATGKTPRQSFVSKQEEAFQSGKLDPTKSYLFPKDLPVNHAAFAIMEAFPDKTPEGDALRHGLLWRALFAVHAVMEDPRAAPYQKVENGQPMVATPLLEAVAVTPMAVGQEFSLDDIFATAARFVAEGRGKISGSDTHAASGGEPTE